LRKQGSQTSGPPSSGGNGEKLALAPQGVRAPFYFALLGHLSSEVLVSILDARALYLLRALSTVTILLIGWPVDPGDCRLSPQCAMKCPFCGFANDKVVDSRESKEAESIRRRRECLKCGKRFTTYERIDEIPYMVVKKDGRREKFDRQKVLNGLLRACEKRPVPISKLEQIVNESESFVMESAERERKTSELGELIMNRLRRYDKVAYVRFASVYLDFKDVKEFMNELKDLVKVKGA
jgi:transcriptional repressor NrdR